MERWLLWMDEGDVGDGGAAGGRMYAGRRVGRGGRLVVVVAGGGLVVLGESMSGVGWSVGFPSGGGGGGGGWEKMNEGREWEV